MRTFTREQLRQDPLRVVGAAKEDGGCMVVDNDGQKLFSLWYPQPADAD